MSLGGGGWISRFGRAETNSEAEAESVRRMVGTAFEGRRAADFLGAGAGAGADAGGRAVLVEAMGVAGATARADTGFTRGVGCELNSDERERDKRRSRRSVVH